MAGEVGNEEGRRGLNAVDQLDPTRAHDAERCRGGQQDLGPCVMGPEAATEAGALRDVRE